MLDADVYGPDLPLMVNVTRTSDLERWELWHGGEVQLEPVERFGLRIMSVGFLLAERQAFPSPALLLQFVLRQLTHGVRWGDLDYLIIDLPPGTADLQQELVRLLPLAGAVVVVGPQDVAHLDARRLLAMLRGEGVRILGGIENMAGLVCPHCGGEIDVFPQVRGDRALCADDVELLARIPLDPLVAQAGESGRPLVAAAPNGPQAQRFQVVARRVAELVGTNGGPD
jgi:ATP-binding protein involved in chromosome partitioning